MKEREWFGFINEGKRWANGRKAGAVQRRGNQKKTLEA